MQKSKKRLRIWLFMLLLVVIAGGIYYYFTSDNTDIIHDGTMISKFIIWRQGAWQ